MKDENTICKVLPQPKDLIVFLTVIRKLSFAAAAEELGQSPAYISKRIGVLETNLATRLFHRSTRKIVLTDDGERTQRWAMRILTDIDDMVDDLTEAQHIPRGFLHICTTFGFGRKHVAPAIAKLSEQFPELEVRLEVFDRAVDIIQEGFDLEIRVGEDLPQQHICKMLKSNNRILCATPDYLEKYGTPQKLDDLHNHSCLVLKERNSPFGIWNLHDGKKEISLPISGLLSSNHGEIVLQWGLQGRGIVMRSFWDVKHLLEEGKLVQILPAYTQTANIWAVYPTRLSHSAKLRVCVEFLEKHLKGI
ncbi:LysR substrate-binding domain-containing protein [uncultured Paraglaciecola sp.]|jgi:LysR family transcriptional activator of dmlA|uniref:LysR substrate-binding domain-containing protein n=1 Tax=uncultured Paraglaciecola sp. TaxID=1765024 RepID=UPI002623E267|nr:LysR substrate-binding domain-containing protein [uncultured Paraglaciecola sp.]